MKILSFFEIVLGSLLVLIACVWQAFRSRPSRRPEPDTIEWHG